MNHPIYHKLLELNYKLADCGDHWRTTAHYREGKNPSSLQISKKTGNWTDYGAGQNGTAEDLIKLISGQTLSFEGYQPAEDFSTKIKVLKIYPESYMAGGLPLFDLFLKRGISKETMEFFGAKLLQGGEMYRRITFPIRSERGIIGFAGRWFQEVPPENKVKWKNFGAAGTKNWVYPRFWNDKIITNTKQIVLVESIGDMLKLWESGIKQSLVMFGLNLSSKRLSYVLGKNPAKIFLAFNNDSHKSTNSGQLASEKIYKKLLNHFSPDQLIQAPPLYEDNDFGCQNVTKIVEWSDKYGVTRNNE